MTQRTNKDILGYLLLGISIIMLGKSMLLCFSSDIWYDELFTVGMIEHSYGELIAFTARDVHPPLYYIITKFAVDLCKLFFPAASVVVTAKMVSVLPYFILFTYCVTLLRRRFSLFAGGLFFFCAVAMPQLSGYTVEVRMYSWAFLFVTAAFIHAYEIVCTVVGPFGIAHECNSLYVKSDEKSGPENTEAGRERPETKRGQKTVRIQRVHAAALVCYGLAAAYTQYFACVAVIMVYLYVLFVWIRKDRDRIKEWLLWAAISIAGYMPWLFILYSQITAVNANYWILPLSWRTFGGCVKFLMKPAFTNARMNTVLAVVFFVLCLAVFVGEGIKLCRWRKERGKNGTACKEPAPAGRFGFMTAGSGVLAGLVLFGFTASVLVRPIFVYRYMIPAMGCFWLGIVAGVDDLWQTDRVGVDRRPADSLHNYILCKLIPAGVTLFIVIIGLRDYRAFMGEEEYKILLMEQTEAVLASIAPADIVICNFDQVQAVTSYYLPAETESYLWCGTPEALIQDIIRPYGMVEDTAQIRAWCEEGRNVWFIGSFNSRDDIVAEWEKDGVKAEETDSCLLERYWFNLYKISV